MSDLSHLRLEGTSDAVPYTFPGGGGGEFKRPERDRHPHAQKLKNDLTKVVQQVGESQRAQGRKGDPDGIVLTFVSEPKFELMLDSLEQRRAGIELLSVATDAAGITLANVFVPRGKLVHFARVVEAYDTEETKEKGNPKHQKLVESISQIRLAAIRDLWQDNLDLPGEDDAIWWEVWLRAGAAEGAGAVWQRFVELSAAQQMSPSPRYVYFPERVVGLAYGTRRQLSGSLDLLATLAELRRAKELATDYVDLPSRWQRAFADDAANRVTPAGENAPAVCILDDGVHHPHPLLQASLRPGDAQTIDPAWGTSDGRQQHGTEMAGIALYGCLTELFNGDGPVQLRHRLESVKFLPPPPHANDPENYGWVTSQAVSLAEIENPQRNRAYCMAVTADDRDLGMPTLWSGEVDQLCSGVEDEIRKLMFVSAGNLRDEIGQAEYLYHEWNCTRGGVEDPGQAWNAVTVGACTEKVVITHPDFVGWDPVARAGDLTPTSRTSLPWPEDNQSNWPIKPDLLMEGGNYAQQGAARSACDDLSLLTTVLSPTGKLLESTRDTSPATAAAARMAATIWSHYPRLWPETVRGLMVHSARWSDAMLARFPGDRKSVIHRCLRCYGYGVPQLRRALYSAENAVTLIYEGHLQPFHKVGSEVRSNEMHVHRLPWPTDVLQGLGETQVLMRVTLSYFIEPSPGRVGWTRKHSYQSHGLRFDVIRPTESDEEFRQRLSRAEWDDPDARPDNAAETRQWSIGDQGRRHGSLHQDWWQGNASDLASSDRIAVYPVSGWWRWRPHLDRWHRAARYSLIVSIETPGVDVDIYTPIVNAVDVSTALDA